MKGVWIRRIWSWHLWMGVALLLPLLWWTGTALVFSLWPIEAVRGATLAKPAKPTESRLTASHLPPAHLLSGARSLKVVPVLGRAMALVDRGAETEVWDIEANRSLGPVIPLAWALESASRDLLRIDTPQVVYLIPRGGEALRMAGEGPDRLEPPAEYTGPRPAYALHYAGRVGLHLYVDALDGQIRARRRAIWRFYDLAFRLHSVEFTGDGLKRGVLLAVCILWLALGVTGAIMAWRRLRPSGSKR